MQKLIISGLIDNKVVLKTRTRDKKGHFVMIKGQFMEKTQEF